MAIRCVQSEDQTDRGAGQSKDKLDPRQIDAYWLQRELSKFYDDAMTSLKRSQEVMEVLEEGQSERDIENRLALLLGYERFDFVKLLRKNRLTGKISPYSFLMENASEQYEDEMPGTSYEMLVCHVFIIILTWSLCV